MKTKEAISFSNFRKTIEAYFVIYFAFYMMIYFCFLRYLKKFPYCFVLFNASQP